MARALGVSVHTGWAACVVVDGTPKRPQIVANQIIDILGDAERFCYHMAAEMERTEARKWLARLRVKALKNARGALSPLVAHKPAFCAIVANDGDADDLDYVLAAHPRIHTAEGRFYRDILREACRIPVHIVPPKTLDASAVAKLAVRPWGRDQRLAALAGWSLLRR